MKKTIIMLSGKAQSGKDSFYKAIEKSNKFENCKRYAFADQLKEIAKKEFNWDGKKDSKGRTLLINVGQILRGEKSTIKNKDNYKNFKYKDIVRTLEKRYIPFKDFWVIKLYEKIMDDKNTKYFFITDYRFFSEGNAIDNILSNENIIKIRINRPGVPTIDDRSEKDLDDFKNWNYILENDNTLENYEKKVIDIFKKEIYKK